MALDFIYDTPNAIVLIIFILVFLSLALIGFFIFVLFTEDGFNKKFNDANTSTYIGAVATAMSIIIAFIITNEYQTFNTTSLNLSREANAIYTLIEILSAYGTEAVPATFAALQYVCSIINVEFPIMQNGELPPINKCLEELQAAVLRLIPIDNKETVLYSKAIDQLDLAINLRNYRLEQTVSTLPAEFYWLLIIGVSVLIILTWFITEGSMFYRLIMISLITIVYSTLITLTVLLDLPFRGFFALDQNAFVLILNQLGVDPNGCPKDGCTNSTKDLSLTEEPITIRNKVSNCWKSSKNINII